MIEPLPVWNYVPFLDGRPEPGHIAITYCPCHPKISWDGDMMEIIHYPLYLGYDYDLLWTDDHDLS